jgi:hypothetical protein
VLKGPTCSIEKPPPPLFQNYYFLKLQRKTINENLSSPTSGASTPLLAKKEATTNGPQSSSKIQNATLKRGCVLKKN